MKRMSVTDPEKFNKCLIFLIDGSKLYLVSLDMISKIFEKTVGIMSRVGSLESKI